MYLLVLVHVCTTSYQGYNFGLFVYAIFGTFTLCSLVPRLFSAFKCCIPPVFQCVTLKSCEEPGDDAAFRHINFVYAI